jgi:hypothetical protein
MGFDAADSFDCPIWVRFVIDVIAPTGFCGPATKSVV